MLRHRQNATARCVFAADAYAFIEGLESRPRRAGLHVVEAYVVVDEVADHLHATPAGRYCAEEVPCDLTETVGLAVATSHEVDEAMVGQIRDRKLTRIWHRTVQFSVIPDCRIAPHGQVASRRNQPPAAVAEQIAVGRYGHLGCRECRLRRPYVGRTIFVHRQQTHQGGRLLAGQCDLVPVADQHPAMALYRKSAAVSI